MDDKIKELGDKLCEFCPWVKGEISHRCDAICEGRYCEDALDNYIDKNEDEKV